MWSKNILYNWNYSKLIWLKIWSLLVSLPYAHKKNIQSEENELLYKSLLDQVDFSFNIFCIWTEFFLLILSITGGKGVLTFSTTVELWSGSFFLNFCCSLLVIFEDVLLVSVGFLPFGWTGVFILMQWLFCSWPSVLWNLSWLI